MKFFRLISMYGFKIITFSVFIAGIICDMIVKNGVILIYVENWHNLNVGIIQVQGTIVTLVIALLSVFCSIFKEKYYGVRVIDYVLFLEDNCLDLTKLMTLDIFLVLLNIILSILGYYNTIILISIYSISIIIYIFNRICFIFKPIDRIETTITQYIEKKFFESTDLRNKLYQHVKELVFDNNYIKAKKYFDFIIKLFSKIDYKIPCEKIDELFDELADCMKECFGNKEADINLLIEEKILDIIKLQKSLLKSKIMIKRDIFEMVYEKLEIYKNQCVDVKNRVYLLFFDLPRHSIEIKIKKDNDNYRELHPYIYSYYISKFIKNIKLNENELTEPFVQVFTSYIDMFYEYYENELAKRIIMRVNSSILLSLYDKGWCRCYETLFFNEYICKYGMGEYDEDYIYLFIQMFYVYINKFYNNLDNEYTVNNIFKDLYNKYNKQINIILNIMTERHISLFTNKNAKLIYDLLENRVWYFYYNFSINDIKEYLMILSFLIESNDDVITEIMNNLLGGDYFVLYHFMFDNEENGKRKFEYVYSLLYNRNDFILNDRGSFKKYRSKIDALYGKHKLDQIKKYYNDCSLNINNSANSLNEIVNQYVNNLIKPFNIVDTQIESEIINDTQKLIDLPIEVASDTEYIFSLTKEYIKNKVASILEECIKNNIIIKNIKVTENNIENFIESINSREFLFGNENFQYWELDRIQAKISDKINEFNSMFLWMDDNDKYLIRINLDKINFVFEQVEVIIRDYTIEEMYNNCKKIDDEYIVAMDTGIKIPLTKNKMIEYFKYTKKIVEVNYKYRFQILDKNDLAEKTIFVTDKY